MFFLFIQDVRSFKFGNHWSAFWHYGFTLPFLKIRINRIIEHILFYVLTFLTTCDIYISRSFLFIVSNIALYRYNIFSLIYLFIWSWSFRLFLVFSYYEWYCYKNSCGLYVNIYFSFLLGKCPIYNCGSYSMGVSICQKSLKIKLKLVHFDLHWVNCGHPYSTIQK